MYFALWFVVRELINTLSPPPKMQGNRARTRKAESAVIVTSSPFKQRVMMKEATGAKKQNTKAQTAKKVDKRKGEGSAGNGKSKGKAPAPKKRRQLTKPMANSASEYEDEASWPCLICGETYSRPREKWIHCQQCNLWAHEDCTAGGVFFICSNCDSDDDM